MESYRGERMIKVECYCRGSRSGRPHETFIVKNPKKIEFWKMLASSGALIRVEDLE